MLGGLVFLVLPVAIWVCYAQAPARGWREASVVAALAWAVGIALGTELLSLFGALRFSPAWVVWLVANSGVAWFAWRAWRRGVRPQRVAVHGPVEGMVMLVLGSLLGLAFVVAIVSPPNTPDVLSYHLMRQVMWLQQGSVHHFVSIDDRALNMPALAEMMQMHAMVLSGGDRWANMPQWVGYVLGVVVASLLARELGAGRRGQWLAALAFATLPMAYLEASSAKNDLLVAVWLGAFAWLALRLQRGGSTSAREWRMAGAALGVALATKSTAFIFAAPILILLTSRLWREWRQAWWLVAMVLLLAGPHWSRNLAWFGSPLGVTGAEDSGSLGSQLHSVRSLISTVVRNATLHAATPSAAVDAGLARGVARLHHALSLDANDPRTTLLKSSYGVVWEPASEVIAGAPVHFWLGLGAIAWWLLRGPRRGAVAEVVWVVVGGALLFCMILKWQPWGARLHLPGFLLLTALIAWAADRLGAWLVTGAGLLCVAGWWPSAEPHTRPWRTPLTIFTTPRWENYFRYHPLDRPPVEACVQAAIAAKVDSLQVVTHYGFPYPLVQRFLAEAGPRATIWGALPAAATTPPDGVVVMEPFDRWLPLYLQLPGAAERFRAVGATDPFGLYVPESRARALGATLPLPRFVGWDTAENLGALEFEARGDRFWRVRRLLAAETRLGFRREATRQHVQLEVANLSAAPCELELRLDGHRVAVVRFEPDATVQTVDVPIAAAGARAELTLVVADNARIALRLAALRIID